MAAQITPLPNPPTPADTPTDFNIKAFSTLGALPRFVDEANDLIVEANLIAGEVDEDAAVALSAKNAAVLANENAQSAKNAAGLSAGTASTKAGEANASATTAAAQAVIATDKAAEAAASAASIAGGPVASIAGLTGIVTTEQTKAELKLPADTVGDLGEKISKVEAAVNPTETARGMPLVATQPQANAGADDTAMLTAKKMAAAMVHNVDDNPEMHRIVLPGGYMLILGSVVIALNDGGQGVFSYPVAFLTRPRLVLTLGDNGRLEAITVVESISGTSQAGVQLGGASANAIIRINYFAMGRVA